MKRIGIGLFLIFIVVGLLWWVLGRDGGPSERTIGLSIVNQTLYGGGPDKVVKFQQGDMITIRLTADEPMEVFFHGYDAEVRIKPGTTSTLKFTADILGRFPLMIHALGEDEGSHKRVEILLGFMDVLPR